MCPWPHKYLKIWRSLIKDDILNKMSQKLAHFRQTFDNIWDQISPPRLLIGCICYHLVLSKMLPDVYNIRMCVGTGASWYCFYFSILALNKKFWCDRTIASDPNILVKIENSNQCPRTSISIDKMWSFCATFWEVELRKWCPISDRHMFKYLWRQGQYSNR